MTRYRRSRSRSRRSAPQRAADGLSPFDAGEVFAAIARAAAAPDEIQAGADSELSSDFEDSVSSWSDSDAANCPGSRVERLLETAEPEDIVLFDSCVQRVLARLDEAFPADGADESAARRAEARDLWASERAARRIEAELADVQSLQDIYASVSWMTSVQKAAACKYAAVRFQNVRDRVWTGVV